MRSPGAIAPLSPVYVFSNMSPFYPRADASLQSALATARSARKSGGHGRVLFRTVPYVPTQHLQYTPRDSHTTPCHLCYVSQVPKASFTREFPAPSREISPMIHILDSSTNARAHMLHNTVLCLREIHGSIGRVDMAGARNAQRSHGLICHLENCNSPATMLQCSTLSDLTKLLGRRGSWSWTAIRRTRAHRARHHGELERGKKQIKKIAILFYAYAYVR